METYPMTDFMPWINEAAKEYYSRIQHASVRSEEFRVLAGFMNNTKQELRSNQTQISVVELSHEPYAPINIHEVQGVDRLGEYLDDTREFEDIPLSRLFLVENIDPLTILLLGGSFDIELGFFSQFVLSKPMHRIQDLNDHIPTLPSLQSKSNCLLFRSIAVREFHTTIPLTQHSKVVYPAKQSTRTERSAFIVGQTKRRGPDRPGNFEPALFARHHTIVWFKSAPNTPAWTGK